MTWFRIPSWSREGPRVGAAGGGGSGRAGRELVDVNFRFCNVLDLDQCDKTVKLFLSM